MRSRRIACLLLGLWMGAGLWMLWVASSNAASADRLLLAPSDSAATYLKSFGHLPLSPLAHYLADQQNRALFEVWGVVQIVFGSLFFFFLLFGTKVDKIALSVALVMLLIVVGERLAIGPGMEMVGHATDLNLDPSHRAAVARDALNFGYKMAEGIKYLLGAIAAAILILQHTRSLDTRKKFDVVDKGNYRHIDR